MKVFPGSKVLIYAILSMAAVFGSCKAFAFFEIFGRTIKPMTCELLMQLDRHSTPGDPMPAIQGAVDVVTRNVRGSDNSAVSFKDVEYSGAPTDISLATARRIVSRLNGIHDQLNGPNLDRQFVVVQIRGDSIQKALDDLERNEALLREQYRSQVDQSNNRQSRYIAMAIQALVGMGALASAGGAAYLGTETGVNIFTQFIAYLTPVLLAGEFGAVTYLNEVRFDSGFSELKRTLHKVANEPSHPTDFFISSSKIVFPSDFHNMLVSKDKSAVEASRHTALKLWGVNPVTWLVDIIDGDHSLLENLGREVRQVYLDHIVYWQNDEPVWVFIYRGLRARRSLGP